MRCLPRDLSRDRLPRLRLPRLQAAPGHPPNGNQHSQPAYRTHNLRNLRVVIEQAQLAEQIIPIVDYIVGVSNRQQRQLLRAGVRHVDGNGKELLKEEKDAKGGALHLTVENEIGSKHERNGQLKECAAGHGNELAGKTEEQMAAFVNGDEYQVHVLRKTGSADRLQKKNRVKGRSQEEHSARDGIPFLFKSNEEGQAFGP